MVQKVLLTFLELESAVWSILIAILRTYSYTNFFLIRTRNNLLNSVQMANTEFISTSTHASHVSKDRLVT